MAWWSFGAQKRLEENPDTLKSYVHWESERYNALLKMQADLEALKKHLDDKQSLAKNVQALIADVERFESVPLPPTSPTVQKLFVQGNLEIHYPELGTIADAQRQALALLKDAIASVKEIEQPLVGGGPLDAIREAQRMLRRLMIDEASFINHAQK